jgi:hypothetical protein
MKFKFFNDTGRIVSIHPGTFSHGTSCTKSDAIQPLEERLFTLPYGTYPLVKMWDYGSHGLSIFISPQKE